MTRDCAPGRLWADRIARLPRPVLLAFDVDGTLARIVDDPAAARVEPNVVTALRALANARDVFLALVTGRDAESLSGVVDVEDAFRAVEHGAILIEPYGVAQHGPLGEEQRKRLEAFERHAASEWVPQGGRLESKRGSRALHVRELMRNDPDLASRLLEEAARVGAELGLRPRSGRGVVECELVSGDKGACLRTLHDRTRARSVVYVGDDVTDLPAIAYAHSAGGLGLFVRSAEGPSGADASGELEGPREVAQLVLELAKSMLPTGDKRGNGSEKTQ